MTPENILSPLCYPGLSAKKAHFCIKKKVSKTKRSKEKNCFSIYGVGSVLH